MEREEFKRTEMLFGREGMEKLNKSHVAVFGVGGVGGYVAEALARSGVGNIDLIDNDVVSVSNINRQIVAYHSTVGEYKVDVAKKRILDINPTANVNVSKCFFLPENADEFDFSKYDYIADCIDTVSGKIALACIAQEKNIKIISSMGAGNKLEPTAFRVADIYKTSICPLARTMRRLCRENNIKNLKCVYSTEEARPVKDDLSEKTESGKAVPGSNAFVPSVAGLIIAGEIIKDIAGV